MSPLQFLASGPSELRAVAPLARAPQCNCGPKAHKPGKASNASVEIRAILKAEMRRVFRVQHARGSNCPHLFGVTAHSVSFCCFQKETMKFEIRFRGSPFLFFFDFFLRHIQNPQEPRSPPLIPCSGNPGTHVAVGHRVGFKRASTRLEWPGVDD